MSQDHAQTRERLIQVEIEHRDLDAVISQLELAPNRDELLLRRLKKRKLQLKDQIIQLQMQLVPDIPA